MEQEKMRAAVCEDVLEEAQWLSDMIYKWYADKGIEGEVSIFEDFLLRERIIVLMYCFLI